MTKKDRRVFRYNCQHAYPTACSYSDSHGRSCVPSIYTRRLLVFVGLWATAVNRAWAWIRSIAYQRCYDTIWACVNQSYYRVLHPCIRFTFWRLSWSSRCRRSTGMMRSFAKLSANNKPQEHIPADIPPDPTYAFASSTFWCETTPTQQLHCQDRAVSTRNPLFYHTLCLPWFSWPINNLGWGLVAIRDSTRTLLMYPTRKFCGLECSRVYFVCRTQISTPRHVHHTLFHIRGFASD